MSRHWDRILDRIWLALSGAAAIAIMLQLGAQVGARPWSIDAVLAAHAAAPASLVRPSLPAGCRDAR
ncbi:hypothetical protein [Methylobacterium pseudosasicola]|uniref:Uncharacterized protein n=1 Tax=Methylobacterium pseudosasicola TaxID=582667 RepID=A0A1I4GLX1_9HYPH|nr:hypothetical protein [Methylobacterium pseudosasicola]SFL30889.1 hypothetical protein SAMN05192568_100390 [Methylobacterium pseudosasicola]